MRSRHPPNFAARSGHGIQAALARIDYRLPGNPGRGYVAFVEELPGADTQGETLEEARANLRKAVELVLEANRALAQEDLVGVVVIRERLSASARVKRGAFFVNVMRLDH